MASNRTLGKTQRPKLFSPAVVREEIKFSVTQQLTLESLADTNFESTSSFRYDEFGMGLRSTQEIPLDWSRFENHTFFNSAQSKVNIAIDRIVNEYPFDGTGKEVEAFEDSLTGYEMHVLNSFPKNRGFLLFSGTQVGEDPSGGFPAELGTFINVIDSAGSQFPLFSKRNDGETIIDFGRDPFSFEFFLRPPSELNSRQIIFQKSLAKESGDRLSVNVALDTSLTTERADLIFAIASGSARLLASASIEKGDFSHICATYDRGGTDKLLLYVSESLVGSSSNSYQFENLSMDKSPFLIGSGSSFQIPSNIDFGPGPGVDFSPLQTLSGGLDEIRVFNSTVSVDDQLLNGYSTIYASPSLKLYFKFNEPSGSYDINDAVLDSSGNSLHSRISNFSTSLRSTGSYTNPMKNEILARCPVLFPSFEPVSNFNHELLSTASYYDTQNPNLITKLIPVHYLLEGQSSQGFEFQDGYISDPITGKSIPGSAQIGSAQYITAFLFIWAKFFDEIKIFIDHFSNVIHPSYDDYETVASKLLPFVANYYGISLPSLFPNADKDQYIDGVNIQDSYSRAQESLSYIQGEIWRRILINLNEIIRSKGTVHSIKTLIRSTGINPDTLLAIREYGGPTKKALVGLRETKSEVASSLDFSGSLAAGDHESGLTPYGFSPIFPHIISPFLSSSRVEVGFPEPSGGSFVSINEYPPHGIYTDPVAGLLTSGSFTYEGIYQFEKNKVYSERQSLVRLQLSASDVDANPKTFNHGVAVTNLLIFSGTENSLTSSGSTLRLYVRPGTNTEPLLPPPLLKLEIVGPNLFDGNLWNISFGRIRGDQRVETKPLTYLLAPISSVGSSSYFLRCARQSYGEIKEIYSTSSFFREGRASSGPLNRNIFSPATGDAETLMYPSGTMVVIGSQSMSTFVSATPFTGERFFLNDEFLDIRPGASAGDRDDAIYTDFEGQVSQIRFWSKALEKENWEEHVRNFKSLGVEDPAIHFNFDTYPTGAFSRLRLDVSVDQEITSSNQFGEIQIADFSQNNFNMSGSGFEINKLVIKPENFYFSHLSPKFDQAQTDNKVRIRSYETAELIERFSYATSAPSYEVLRSEEPFDDTRFTIEFSAVKAIDEDMMNMFGTLEFFDESLGRTNLLFDEFYPDIDQARKIYFKRLTGKPDYQIFFDMYKWFNSALGSLIEQMIPKKTKFLGINFVIESHVLERNRFRYLFDDIYLLAWERNIDRSKLEEYSGFMKH